LSETIPYRFGKLDHLIVFGLAYDAPILDSARIIDGDIVKETPRSLNSRIVRRLSWLGQQQANKEDSYQNEAVMH
jgi:hypothetical protein